MRYIAINACINGVCDFTALSSTEHSEEGTSARTYSIIVFASIMIALKSKRLEKLYRRPLQHYYWCEVSNDSVGRGTIFFHPNEWLTIDHTQHFYKHTNAGEFKITSNEMTLCVYLWSYAYLHMYFSFGKILMEWFGLNALSKFKIESLKFSI